MDIRHTVDEISQLYFETGVNARTAVSEIPEEV